MSDDIRARFEAGTDAWVAYNHSPLGHIRREVTWHNLLPYLPGASDTALLPRVLDVGGGSGELALRLVRHGHHVWLLDYAPAMLDQARRAAQDLPSDVRTRLSLCPMAVEAAPQAFAPDFFDVITCHTLIEYLPDPRTTLHSLAGLLSEGGLLSISFVNRHTEVLRQAWSRVDPAGALASLERGTFCATLFDVAGTAHAAEDVSAWLSELRFGLLATCGVRAFADWIPRERLDDPAFFDDLLRLEVAAATRAPYNLMARYIHLIARKNVER
jgi:S-adenosylmethionine-dependent methyltransferase